jgi:hypothetical protein
LFLIAGLGSQSRIYPTWGSYDFGLLRRTQIGLLAIEALKELDARVSAPMSNDQPDALNRFKSGSAPYKNFNSVV